MIIQQEVLVFISISSKVLILIKTYLEEVVVAEQDLFLVSISSEILLLIKTHLEGVARDQVRFLSC